MINRSRNPSQTVTLKETLQLPRAASCCRGHGLDSHGGGAGSPAWKPHQPATGQTGPTMPEVAVLAEHIDHDEEHIELDLTGSNVGASSRRAAAQQPGKERRAANARHVSVQPREQGGAIICSVLGSNETTKPWCPVKTGLTPVELSATASAFGGGDRPSDADEPAPWLACAGRRRELDR